MTSRAAAGLVGITLGAVAGVALAFVHADRIRFGPISLDFGVPLAVGTLLLGQLWLARALQRRSAALGVALGWLAATVLVGSANTSGDVALPATPRAMVYLAVAAMVLTMGMLVPVLRRPGGHRRLADHDVLGASGDPSAARVVSLGDDRTVGGNP